MTRCRRAALGAVLVAGCLSAPAPVAARPVETRSAVAVSNPVPVAPPNATWLETVNAYRTQSGLQPVTEEPAWTAGMYKHIVYLRSTEASLRTGQYASAHT